MQLASRLIHHLPAIHAIAGRRGQLGSVRGVHLRILRILSGVACDGFSRHATTAGPTSACTDLGAIAVPHVKNRFSHASSMPSAISPAIL